MSKETISQSDLRPPTSDLRTLTSDLRPLASNLRVGVVVCDCGDKIAGVLDTESLRRQAAALPEVVYAARDAYPCSKDGQARLRQAIAEQRLDRVLIAGCAPRLVEKLFHQTAQAAGLDNGYVEIAGIREQCAFVHADNLLANAKAADLIEMGVARLASITPRVGDPRQRTSRVVKSALVIGSDLSGLTAALALADGGLDVTLVEPASALGGSTKNLDDCARELIAERSQAALRHPHINTLLNARVTDVAGHAGDYTVSVTHSLKETSGDQAATCAVGAILVAASAHPQSLNSRRWHDRSRVVTQAEFETELDRADLALNDIVMLLCGEADQEIGKNGHCSRVCCAAGIRQAIRAKQRNPNANVTILFRDLYLGGESAPHQDALYQAKELGVTFFRYRKDHPPTIGDKTVDVLDTLTGEPVRVPFDRAVLSTPMAPPDNADMLAALLRVPQDENGFMVEPRVRLRPGRYADDGIYVLGGAHQPADTTEALFQAYMTSSRAQRFLSQDAISVKAPVAEINATLCTGCGSCAQVCPTFAITLEKRDGGVAATLSLSEVDPLRCIGCGNCVVICPVRAITLPGWGDAEILAQISAALRAREDAPSALRASRARVVALACEWSAYAAADMAGARRVPYPADVRIIRMNCSARFDPYHILWAFINGADGVFLGACPPGECHYGTGNWYAQERVEALKKLLAERRIDPRRLRLEFISGDDGEQFAKAMTGFMTELETRVANHW